MDKNNRKHVLIASDSKCQAKGRIFKENEKLFYIKNILFLIKIIVI